MTASLKLIMAQINVHVGNILGNVEKMIYVARSAVRHFDADMIIFPELSLCGYPPEDLLFRPDFNKEIEQGLKKLCKDVKDVDLIVGLPLYEDDKIYNAAVYIKQGDINGYYRKQEIPNYGVFDEKRYFSAGNKPYIITKNKLRLAVTICEDLWLETVATQAKTAKADAIISLNASPFDMRKPGQRQNILKQRAKETALPIIYTHCIGGQDELVFDGGSLAVDSSGKVNVLGPAFKEALLPVNLTKDKLEKGGIIKATSIEEQIYRALMLAVKDYINKNGFQSALVGLSGGIDSALTLTIASDALGADKVEAIMMPSRHTSDMSIEDAELLATNLHVAHRTISIEESYQAFLNSLSEEFEGLATDITEENLQARCRGVLLMAISNKKGSIVLTTGNKSEMAVGYATLYGDMAGGFAVIKDVPKTLVYRLANFRNSVSPVIPQRIIDRAPTAELAPEQTDQDTLPPYDDLDEILRLYVEQDKSIRDICKRGYEKQVVQQVISMVDQAEYKRRQAPPGPRITDRAFGRERRYPITSGFKANQKTKEK